MSPARHASAAHDAASTQHTLSHVLGNLGGRQKPWMMGPVSPTGQQTPQPPRNASPPKHNRGRPRIVPRQEPPPQPEPERQRSAGLADDRHPGSSSMSPQLANTVSHPPRASPVHSPHAVLPSPAPSEDIAITAVRNSSTASAGVAGVPIAQSPGFEGSRFVEELHQMASPTGWPRGQPSAEDVVTPRQEALRAASSLRGGSGNSQQFFGVSIGGQAQHARGRPQPQSAPTQNGAPTQHSAPYYTQELCRHSLQRFRIDTLHPTDPARQRAEALVVAINKQDWDYLTLHQIYCLLDTNRSSLPAGITEHEHLRSAHNMLEEVIGCNQLLSAGALQFFGSFPLPLQDLRARWPEMYRFYEGRFLLFVAHSHKYSTMKNGMWLRDQEPPLMVALHLGLGVVSPCLQNVIFTATVRNLFSMWGLHRPQTAHLAPEISRQFEAEAVNLLEQCRADFVNRQRLRPPDAPASGREVEGTERHYELIHFGGRLQEMCTRQQMHIQSLLQMQPPFVMQPVQAQAQAQQWQQLRLQQLQQQTSLATLPSNAAPAPAPAFAGPPLHTSMAGVVQYAPPVAQASRAPAWLPVQAPAPLPTPAPFPTPRTSGVPASVQMAPRPLLPPPGTVLPTQREANPAMFALHEAHLRSPTLVAPSVSPVLYQYVSGFLRPPTRLTEAANHRVEEWRFTLSAEQLQSLPNEVPGTNGAPATRFVQAGGLSVRLRGIKWSAEELPDDSTWAVSDTSWCPQYYFSLNGSYLYPRSKLHYGKCLPIDMTGLIRKGENILSIAVQRKRDSQAYLDYLLAIELVAVQAKEDILRSCQLNRLDSEQVLGELRRKVSQNDDADDEIAIVQSNLTINLRDPYTATSICEIPVRSRTCLHSECFDLEIFLQTRERKDDASLADVWKCPICKADARPQSLVVDGFLESVRAQLAERGLLHIRAIVVDQDGNWEPKHEADEPITPVDEGFGVAASRSMSARATTSGRNTNARATPVEIIDLSD